MEEKITSRPIGPFTTIDERCQRRWPLSSTDHRRRIRDTFVAKHLQRLGRYPYKLTGYANGTIVCEEEHLSILDDAIDRVRNDDEWRRQTPLFDRRRR